VWTWARVDYELDWPAELLGSELLALRDHPHRAWTAGEVKLLLREAFHTNVPVNDFTRLSSAGEWVGDLGPGRGWVDDLFNACARAPAVLPAAAVLGCAARCTGRATGPSRGHRAPAFRRPR
jgi:hypothetical protein